MSFIAAALIGGAVIGGISTSQAASTQAQAAEQAGQQQLALGREQLEASRPARELALQQARFQFGQQQQLLPAQVQQALAAIPQQQAFADLAQQALPLIQQDILAEPGTSPLFQRALQSGTEGIISNLAPFGLTDSSVSGRAIGEFGAGLSAQDLENIRSRRFQVAGFQTFPQAQVPSSQFSPTAGLGTAAQLQQGGILSGLQAGQTTAAGQLGLGRTLAQLPLLSAFNPNIFGGTPGGTNAFASGLTSSQSTGLSTFQNPFT